MFSKIVDWIKKVVKIFYKNDVKRTLGVDVAISDKMTKAIELWGKMYDGCPPWLSEEVQSLNLPSAIASELARLTTIEMKSEVSGSARADFLNGEYQRVIDDLRRYIEYGCAKGGLILKPYADGGGIAVDYIQADSFLPVAFDNSGRITGAVFVDQIQQGERIYTRIEYHNLTDGGYEIKNLAFKSSDTSTLGSQIPLESVDSWGGLEPEVLLANVNIPMFAYFKVPHANTVDTKSPLGVSGYARAVDLIKEADKQYSRLLWEFESGDRAVYVSDTAFRKGENGNPVLPHKRLYRIIDGTLENKLYEDFTPTLREQNILNGLDAILIKIEDSCGLARGTFSNPQTEVRTATELKILKQRSYATVADMQKSLQRALEDLTAAMDIWCTLYNLAPKGKYETSFEWDDSIVADRQVEFIEKQQLVTAGIMQKWEFRVWYMGETEEQARKMISETAPEPDFTEDE
jgi:A118 family predicted phage portal protein